MLAAIALVSGLVSPGQAQCDAVPRISGVELSSTGASLEDGGIVGRGALYVDAQERLFYLDFQDRVVKTFDAAGEARGSFGSAGSGPGQFTNARGIGGREGIVWVREGVGGPLQIFWSNGEHLRTVRAPGLPGASPLQLLAPLGDGLILASSSPLAGRMDAGGQAVAITYVRLAEDGSTKDTAVTVSADATVWVLDDILGAGSRMVGPSPFARAGAAGVSPAGDRIVVIVPGGLERSEGVYEVRSHHLGARTQRTALLRYEPIRVTDAVALRVLSEQLDEWEASFESRGRPFRRDEVERRLLESVDLPAFLSPIEEVVLATDGDTWLKLWSVTDQTENLWCVLNESLAPVVVVELPVDVELLAAQGDRIWGYRLGPFDIPQLVSFAIERPGDP